MASKIDVLIGEYITIRDEIGAKRKAFNAAEEVAKENMAILEAQLLEISNDTGVESFKTAAGTAFRTTKDYCRVEAGGREKVDEWIMRTGHVGILTSHVSKLFVKELMEGPLALNPSEAGLEYIQESVMQIRRPTK